MSDFPSAAKVRITSDRVVKVTIGRPRPYYSRSGTARLDPSDGRVVVVTFNTPLKDANWVFAGLTFWNIADADIDVVQLAATSRLAKSASGFTLLLAAPPPSDNYYLDWSIAEAYDP